MRVREFMTRSVECVGPTMTVKEAAQQMRIHNIGVLPIWDNGRLVGTITDRDIVVRVVAKGLDTEKVPIWDVMTLQPVFCFQDQDIREVARLMEKAKIRRIPVMGRDNRLAGMLSLDDLTKAWEGQDVIGEVLEAVAAKHV